LAISNLRRVSSDKALPYAKGVGAEDSYVKSCIRHGEIRFTVLSYFLVRRAIVFLFNGTFNDSLAKDCHFFMCIHKRQALKL